MSPTVCAPSVDDAQVVGDFFLSFIKAKTRMYMRVFSLKLRAFKEPLADRPD
jgi:hypothetical protein